jgi:predicted 3-demethylubiquinone-9 3-methyltransferase (glyoxalase superfamily)
MEALNKAIIKNVKKLKQENISKGKWEKDRWECQWQIKFREVEESHSPSSYISIS